MPAKKTVKSVLPQEERTVNKPALGLSILVVLLAASLLSLAILYQKYNRVKQELLAVNDPQAQQARVEAENKATVSEVGKFMVLPEGEPTLGTVMDAASLAKEQPFFKDAKNGDKVLIYKDRAIIYNPTEKRIVNVGPIFPSGEETALRVEVRNGSAKIGAGNELAQTLKDKGFDVATVANAVNTEYQGLTLVNLGDKDVSALEKELGVTAVKEMPAEEATSTADVVVILGAKE